LLVREEVLLAGLCERKILFRLEIYDRLRQATVKRTGCNCLRQTQFTNIPSIIKKSHYMNNLSQLIG